MRATGFDPDDVTFDRLLRSLSYPAHAIDGLTDRTVDIVLVNAIAIGVRRPKIGLA